MLGFFDNDTDKKKPSGFQLEPTDGFLTGKLLIAAPLLNGSYFDHSVICVCAHNEEGAMGIMLTQPLVSIQFSELLEQMNIDTGQMKEEHLVHCGGPVDLARGFVLHTNDIMHDESLPITDNLAVTATVFMLDDIAQNKGPEHIFFSLGYAGWGDNQLETEIQTNSWLTADSNDDLLFHTEGSQKWERALHSIGIDPNQLTSFSGSA